MMTATFPRASLPLRPDCPDVGITMPVRYQNERGCDIVDMPGGVRSFGLQSSQFALSALIAIRAYP